MTPIQPYALPSIPSGARPVTSPSSPTSTQIQAVRDTLDLSSTNRSPQDIIQTLDKEDRNTYLTVLSRLLKAGVVGIETLEVRGQRYQSFASNRFIDPDVTNAKTHP